ncbi:MAG: hypothetical protein R3B81_13025 [bacterium]
MSARGSSRRRVLLGLLAAGVASAIWLRLDPRALFAPGSGEVLARFFRAALSPALLSSTGASLWPDVLDGIRATVAFAAGGMTLAIALGLPLGYLASSAWWDEDPSPGRRRRGRVITSAARWLIAGMRSVHELLWAMILLAALGRSTATAIVAIAIPYGGTLAKVWSELIDESPRGGARALRAIGARPGQSWLLGLAPRTLSDFASYAFYRFECALRSSAILGFLGFPTLGYHLSLAFDNLRYPEVWTFLYALLGLILAVELWSAALRRREGWA